jgi:hypothetical protein
MVRRRSGFALTSGARWVFPPASCQLATVRVPRNPAASVAAAVATCAPWPINLARAAAFAASSFAAAASSKWGASSPTLPSTTTTGPYRSTSGPNDAHGSRPSHESPSPAAPESHDAPT